MVRAYRWIEAAAAGFLRPWLERVARVVAGRPHPRIRLESHRPQFHRLVHAGSADSFHCAVHIARFAVGMVARWKKDRILASARRWRSATLAAGPARLGMVRHGCRR